MGRGLCAESAKLSDQVCLIGVAMFSGETGPGFARAHRCKLPDACKSRDSHKAFRGDAHRRAKTPLQLPGRDSRFSRDLCDRRHGIRTGQPVHRGDHLLVGRKSPTQLIEKHLIKDRAARVGLQSLVIPYHSGSRTVQVSGHLREPKDSFRELGRGLSQKAGPTSGMKSDSKRVHEPTIVQAKSFRQKTDDCAGRLEPAVRRPHKPDRIAQIEYQLDVPIGQDCRGRNVRSIAKDAPVRGHDSRELGGFGKPFFVGDFH
jgi:hypothetical protein